jgi:5-dehydro-2-deoxygluconokinase
MLAADHRWQWEEWCDTNGIARTRIPEAKRLALDGLLAARERAPGVRDAAAFLVDQQYASSEIERGRAARVTVGTPLERAGVFPLEWAASPFWNAVAGDFAKVLVRHRPEWETAARQEQLSKLKELGDWCHANDRVFLLEVLVVARAGEREEEFERSVRPFIVAQFIREAYAAGVVPDFWKIEGTTLESAMRLIDAAVAEHPTARIVILGKGAGFGLIEAWFAAAAAAPRATGFAIGRSVYWAPAADHLLGRIDAATAVSRIADNYLRVVDAWKAASPEDAR